MKNLAMPVILIVMGTYMLLRAILALKSGTFNPGFRWRIFKHADQNESPIRFFIGVGTFLIVAISLIITGILAALGIVNFG